jgi:hypothetical protein
MPVLLRTLLGVFFCFFGKEGSQTIEALLPKRTAVADPFLGGLQTFGFHAAGAHAANFFGMDQSTFFQDLQMLDNGGQGDVQRLRQFGNSDGAFAQLFDDGTAGGITEGMKNTIDGYSLT